VQGGNRKSRLMDIYRSRAEQAAPTDPDGWARVLSFLSPPLDERLVRHVYADRHALDPAGILISSLPADNVEATFDGTSFVVLFGWDSSDGNYPNWAVRVSPEGAVLDATPIPLPVSLPSAASVGAPGRPRSLRPHRLAPAAGARGPRGARPPSTCAIHLDSECEGPPQGV
jgi:hypothetical protein